MAKESPKPGDQLYVIVRAPEHKIDTVLVTHVGKQWFDYTTKSGDHRKEQLKFIAEKNVQYSSQHNQYIGDKFFYSAQDACKKVAQQMSEYQNKITELTQVVKECQLILAQNTELI